MDSNIFDNDQLTMFNKHDRASTYSRLSNNFRITGSRVEAIGIKSTDISAIQNNLSTTDFDSFIQVIDNLSNSFSILTIIDSVSAFNNYFKKTGISEITIEGLSCFHELCRTHQISNKNYANLKLILKRWHQLNLLGVDDDIIDFLLPIENPKPKRPRGSRVRSDDPEEGWYTDNEYHALIARIWSDYESEKISLHNATLLLLSAQYGRRPLQLSQLKIGDLKSTGETCGVSGRRIEFPGLKDKNSGGFRQSKIEVHPMGDDLWRLCKLQVTNSVNRFEACLRRKLNQEEIRLLPLFSAQTPELLQRRIDLSAQLSTNTANMLNSEVLHQKISSVIQIIREGLHGDPIISERTGLALVQNAYRNRYTRARQLARMGIPKTTLQYWMGHESRQSLDSLDAYYDDPAERARVLNDQITPLMAPLSQAFQGTLKDKEADAIRGDDPTSRIELDGRDESGVGTCGEHGFCAASVPIPCYRCTKFQPWVYGPHREVLERLLERQKLENDVPRTGQGKRLLVPAQLDNDIEAVRTVIALCENRKKVLDGTQ